MRRTPVIAMRVLLALVFGIGAAAKVAHLEEFAAAIASYGIASSSAITIVAALVIGVEIALATVFATGWRVRQAAGASAVIVAVFGAIAAHAWLRGAAFDCGCFPGVLREQLGLPLLVRNAVLFVISTALFVLHRRGGDLLPVVNR